jgi:hypothetical protein
LGAVALGATTTSLETGVESGGVPEGGAPFEGGGAVSGGMGPGGGGPGGGGAGVCPLAEGAAVEGGDVGAGEGTAPCARARGVFKTNAIDATATAAAFPDMFITTLFSFAGRWPVGRNGGSYAVFFSRKRTRPSAPRPK